MSSHSTLCGTLGERGLGAAAWRRKCGRPGSMSTCKFLTASAFESSEAFDETELGLSGLGAGQE